MDVVDVILVVALVLLFTEVVNVWLGRMWRNQARDLYAKAVAASARAEANFQDSLAVLKLIDEIYIARVQKEKKEKVEKQKWGPTVAEVMAEKEKKVDQAPQDEHEYKAGFVPPGHKKDVTR